MRHGPWIDLLRTTIPAIWLTLAGGAYANVIPRSAAETDDALMGRVLAPSAELAQKVVRSTEVVAGKTTLIGFASVENEPLIGHLLVGSSNGSYQHVEFRSCDIEGDTPQLLAVFFARTGKSGRRALAVLCRWDVRHAVAEGTLYGAEFYRISTNGSAISVEPISDLNAKFKTEDVAGVDEDGRRFRDKPTFKTVADVKRRLAAMGLKQ